MQTPAEFIAKWIASPLKERSASQEHFLDLCRLIGHPTPAQSDPDGDHFTFVPSYPDRILPVSDVAAAELKKRTQTNLYNTRPSWLANAHRTLDEAVAAAYGWPSDVSDDEILSRLLQLNRERSA